MSSSKGAPGKVYSSDRWLPMFSWGVAFLFLIIMIALLARRAQIVFSASPAEVAAGIDNTTQVIPAGSSDTATLPDFQNASLLTVRREADAHTIIPSRPRSTVVEYTVSKGDSIFSISNKYKLKPETVLWANYDLLDDNPNMVSIGQKLKIPPVNGVYYTWEKNDSLVSVTSKFKAAGDAILAYPGNRLDLTNPVIQVGQHIMIPDGWRENRQWIVPTVWRANSGASRNLNGPGACELPAGGAYGTGAFVWPTVNHSLSGNDYWSGHLGIDIAAADGAPLYATDSGMVVYSGSIGGGYGLMIMIDHGNGYHTLYAHLSSSLVKCGQSVSQGQVIGYTGNSGNSTGPHLHFEVRLNGGFVNPWYVLR